MKIPYRNRAAFFVLSALLILLAGVSFGSVKVPPGEILAVILHHLFHVPLGEHISPSTVAIVWDIRIPRVLSGFLVGGALSVSGAVMQSVLQNPLASSYTLGVSAGASLSVLLVLTFLPALAAFLPVIGFLGGMLAIFFVLKLSASLDNRLQNGTVILVGMIISLFASAMITLVSVIERNNMERLLFWQMGSLSQSTWTVVKILFFTIFLLGTVLALRHIQLDILTFGDEQASLLGISVKREKILLLLISSALTGICVAFTGIIGFVDLIAPHVVRKCFSPAHRWVLPFSFIFGGSFLVLTDLIARALFSPVELPVGAVTAFLGAPFFFFLFWKSQKSRETI